MTTGLIDDPARLQALHAEDILDTAAEHAFDDIVSVAAALCGTPTALVSFVTDQRQWFKARIGFVEPQTGLESSVCAHVLDQPALLVIPDLTRDPRTAANPLVTGDSGIRFYAGVPLRLPTGEVLGALCVIDTVARPAGLTDAQAAGLSALGRQTVRSLDLRRRVREGAAASARQRDAHDAVTLSEAHWRGLVEAMADGFIVAEAIRDEDRAIVDWRYVYVNRAFTEILGLSRTAVVGGTVTELFPGIERAWIDVAGVVDTQEIARFRDRLGQRGRWYEGRGFPLGGDRFSISFRDVTEAVEAARRQDALLRLGDTLRQCTAVADMTRSAARIVGETMSVTRAGYGRLDALTETVEIEPDWTAPGVATVAGRYRFEDFGRIRDELARGEPLVLHDVLTDPRTAADPGPMQALGIGALVNMPVHEHGRTVAVFLVHDDRPRTWTAEELIFLRAVADRLEADVARLQAEDQQRVLNQELSHRLKNTLMMVQAIASQTLKGSDRTALDAFDARLQSLGTAHDVLLQKSWRPAALGEVIDRVLGAFAPMDRIDLAGAPAALGPRAVLATSMLLHELATNAMKYGALSSEAGRLEIAWDVDAEEVFTLRWTERGGPPVDPPTRRGLGSRLIKSGLMGSGGVDLRYDRAGFRAAFRANMSELVSE